MIVYLVFARNPSRHELEGRYIRTFETEQAANFFVASMKKMDEEQNIKDFTYDIRVEYVFTEEDIKETNDD